MSLRFVENHVPENHIAQIVLAATCASAKEDAAELLPTNETATVAFIGADTEDETVQLNPISGTASMAFGFVESHVPESLRLRVLVVCL